MQNQTAPPLQTDQVSAEVLRNLLSNEAKPNELTPLDILLTAYLIDRRAFDHEIYDSQSTLALRLCTDPKAVKRSLVRLEKLRWISYRNRRNGKVKGISLNPAKLPAAQPVRERITAEAERLVDFYIELKKALVSQTKPVIANGKLVEPKLKLPRNWKQLQLPSAQRLLTHYGDFDLTSRTVQALFHHDDKGIQSKSRKSLYNLLSTLPKARRLQQQARSRAVLEEVARATEAAFSPVTMEARKIEGIAA